MSQPDTEPPDTADACAAEDRTAAVETGGMESDPLADTPPCASSRRDVVTGGMSSDPIDDPGPDDRAS